MQFIVAGAGATGSLIAAYLTRAGRDVLLVDKAGDRLSQVRAEGVQLTGFRGDLNVKVSAAAFDAVDSGSPAEFILICVHPDDLTDTLDAVRRFSDERTTFVPFLSGLSPLALRRAVGDAQTIGAVANFECRLMADGAVETDFHNFIWLGEFDSSNSERIQTLQLALSHVAPTFLTKVIEGIIWSKAIYSLEAALSALVNVPPKDVYGERRHRRLAAALVRENINLANAAGVTPIAFDFFDPNLYQASNARQGEVTDVWIRNAWIRHEQFRVGLDHPFDVHVGLSWLLSPANPQHEAAALFDALAAQADALGQPLPLTYRLTEIHRSVSLGKRSLGWDNLDLLESYRQESEILVPYPEL